MTKRFVPDYRPKAVPLSPGHAVPGEMRRVPVGDVHVLEHLNLRVRGTPEYDAAVDEFAASIEANGFYDDKPLAGYLDADGRVIVIDGHRRLEAVRRLNSHSLDGDVVTEIPVVLKGEDSTLADLTVAMIQSSSGKELTMLEKGIGVRRLMADGMTKEEVARRLGVTEKSVDNYLAVASVPVKARDLLLDGKVTSTQVLRAKGDVEKLTAMAKRAAEKGRTRARPSDAEETAAAAPSPSPAQPVAPATEPSQEGLDTVDFGTGSPALTDHYVVPVTDDALVFDIPIVKDAEMGALMRQLAAEIRSRVPHDQGDSDAAHVGGTITVSVSLAAAEKPKRSRKTAAQKRAEEAGVPAAVAPDDDAVPPELAHAIVSDDL